MIDINKIYEKEKEINSFFREKYDYSDSKIFNKQVLELLSEINELAYETNCFKYWKDDKDICKERILKEYADVLMIALSFCDLANVDKIIIKEIEKTDLVELLINLNYLSSQINMDLDNELLFDIMSNIFKISEVLNFSKIEIEKTVFNKMEETLKMIKEG